MPDLSSLSDDELSAVLLLLGEQAQELSNATACVRREQQRRAAPPDPGLDLGEYGTAALGSAVEGAPARAKEIAAVERSAMEAAQADADG